ncbi:sensor histidine kinase [Jeotgalibacillus sp. ET6]|uniref:sensor histidine kinase n=1 Tax=Jeotgalibacillus sp. ET6 TaxID=3037260 RepID=UPI0024188309|nr:sensor histidine kinase [Jeotgalibacillus sp. ET6]MDG5473554.1 sensor histidine kinase [Jeotgalibacillus sp. ET6]
MKQFWVRFSLFSLIWILIILFQSENKPVSILIFAGALSVYFFLSLNKSLFLLYIIQTLFIVSHGIWQHSEVGLYVVALLYLSIEASFRIKQSYFLSYILLNLLSSLIITWLSDGRFVEWLLLTVLVYFPVLKLNRMIMERNEQKEIYETLLNEYRKVKRLSISGERNARLEERTRIAGDIHDSVGHRLTALIMKLEVLTIQDNKTGYTELKRMAQESLNETRHAVKALQTEENEGIATVVHLIRKLEAESHILVQFTMKQGVLSFPISNETSVVLYRVIQEALTNAMRHAQSREVHITLGKSAADSLSFEIRNSIFKAEAFSYGFGLTNMKKRAEELDGNLEAYQTEKEFIVRGAIPILWGEKI